MIVQIILTILTTIFLFQVGILVDQLIFNSKHADLAETWALGIGTTTSVILLMSLLSIPITQILIFIFLGIAYLPFIVSSYLRDQALQRIKLKRKHLVLVIPVIIVSILTFTQSIWGSDAYGFWLSKAHAFWIDGGITKANLNLYWPFDHPILWPAIISIYYQVLGNSNEYLIQIIPLVTYVMIAVTIFKHTKSNRYLWTFIFLLTPFIWQNVTLPKYTGNADLIMSLFLVLAVSNIFKNKIIYTALFLFFAVLTKNDTLPAMVSFIVLYPLLHTSKIKFNKNISWDKTSWITSIILLLITFAWKKYYGLESRYINQSITQVLNTRPIIEYMSYSAHAFREEFRQLYRWGIGWWVVIFYLLVSIKRIILNRNLLLVLAMITVQILGYMWVYYVTPEDQASQISTSIFRLVLQIYPASLLLAAKLSEPT